MDELSDDDADESEDGSSREGELKGTTVGLNSPFGLIGQIKDKRGYTHRQIMWGQSWLMYVLELADQPRHIKKRKIDTFDNAEDLRQHLNNKKRNGAS